MNRTRRLLATTALLLAPPLAALAQGPADGGPPPDGAGHGRHGPPPEAIAACKGKAVGTTASFTDRGGRTVTGPCTQMGDVVAVPPPHGEHGPREAASQSMH
jgi:hypothetical protein